MNVLGYALHQASSTTSVVEEILGTGGRPGTDVYLGDEDGAPRGKGSALDECGHG